MLRSAAARAAPATGRLADHGRWRCRRVRARAAVLDRLGDLVVHVGPVGAGTRAKLARNLLHFVAFTAATEAQRLAEAAGIDLRVLGRDRPAYRRDHRRPGGDHAGATHRHPLADGQLVSDLRRRAQHSARRTCAWPIELADAARRSTYRSRESRSTDLGPGLGLDSDARRAAA